MALKVGELFATLNLDSGKFNNGLSGALSALSKFGTLALDVGKKAASSIIEVGSSFEEAMSQVAATMGTTVDQIGRLSDVAKELGATTAFSATQAAQGLNILAQSGLSAEEQIATIDDVLNLAAAGGIDMATSAGYIATAVKGWGDSFDNAGTYADVMAKGATLANTSVDALGEAISGIAPTAASYGQELDGMTVALLRLAEMSITGSEAATGLKRVMQILYAPTSSQAEILSDLGVSAYDASGNARELNEVIADMQTALAGMGEAQRNATVSSLFGARGLSIYNAMVASGTDKVNEFWEGVGSAGGSAAQQAETMLDNLSGDITIFKSALEGAQIAMYESSSGILREAVQGATGIVSQFQAAVESGFDTSSLEGIFTSVFDLVGNLGSQIAPMLTNGIDAFTRLLPTISKSILSGVTRLASDLKGLLPKLLKNIGKAIPDMIRGALDLVPVLVDIASDAIADAAETIIGMLPDMLIGIATSLVSALPKIFESVLSGTYRIAESFVNGIESALKSVGLMDLGFEDIIEQQVENIDPDLSAQLHESASIEYEFDGVTITFGDYSEQVEAARETIVSIVSEAAHLSTEQKTAISEAISKGDAAAAVKLGLDDMELPEGSGEKLAQSIFDAVNEINTTLDGLELDTTEVDEVKKVLAEGGSVGDVAALLVSYGVDEEAASAAAQTLVNAVGELDTALTGLTLTTTQIDKVKGVLSEGGSVADVAALLTSYGVSVEDANAAAQTLVDATAGMNSAFAEMSLDDTQILEVKDLLSAGGSVAEVAKLLTSFGVDSATAEKQAQTLVDSAGSLNSAFGSLSLDNSGMLTTFLTAATVDSALMRWALQMLGFDSEQISALCDSYSIIAADVRTKLSSAFDNLVAALTNGIPDDADEQFTAAKKAIGDFFDSAYEVVDEWEARKKAELEASGLQGEDLTSAYQAVEEEASTLRTQLDSTQAAVNQWITDMTNKPADYVRAHIDELYALLDEVEAVNVAYNDLTGGLMSVGAATRSAVEGGYLTDAGSRMQAISYTSQELNYTLGQIAAEQQAAWESAAAQYGSDSEAYANAVQTANEIAAAKTQSAYDNYDRHMDAIIAGIAANTPALAEAIASYAEIAPELDTFRVVDDTFSALASMAGQLPGYVETINGEIDDALASGMNVNDWLATLTIDGVSPAEFAERLGLDPEVFTAYLRESFANGGLDASGFAQAVFASISGQGVDPYEVMEALGIDPAHWDEAIQEMFTTGTSQWSSQIGGALSGRVDSLWAEVAGVIASGDMSEVTAILNEAVASGLITDAEGYDFSNVADVYRYIFEHGWGQVTDVAAQTAAEAGAETDVTVTPEVAVEPEYTVADDGGALPEEIAAPAGWTPRVEGDVEYALDEDDTSAAAAAEAAVEAVEAQARDATLALTITGFTIDPASAASAQSSIEVAMNAALRAWSPDASSKAMPLISTLASGIYSYTSTISSALTTVVGAADLGDTGESTGADLVDDIGSGIRGSDLSGAAKSVASEAASAVRGMRSSFSTAGGMLSSGIASGIRGGKSGVISAAVEVVRAAIRSANAEAEIESPSRVMMQTGRYFSQGFALGIAGDSSLAAKAAAGLVSSAIEGASVRDPGAGLSAGAEYAAAQASVIDYERLADAIVQRPAVFVLNGRTIARAMQADVARSQRNMDRRAALGTDS